MSIAITVITNSSIDITVIATITRLLCGAQGSQPVLLVASRG